MTYICENITTEGLLDTKTYRVQAIVQDTASSSLVLTVSSVSYLIFTGTVAGQIVQMGDATTYQIGHTYLVHNSSTQRVTVQDSIGGTIHAVSPNYQAKFVLRDNSTAAGVWVFGLSTSTDSFWVFENGLLTWSDSTGADLLIQQIGGLGSAYVRQVSANGTPDAPTATTNGQRLGGYGYYGWNSGGTNGMPSAEDLITASEDHTPTSWGGDRAWNTIPNGSITSTERMRLTNLGNLLIGTTLDNTIDELQIVRGGTTNISALDIFDDLNWTTLGSGTNPNSVVSVTSGSGSSVTVEVAATGNDYIGQIILSTGTTNSGHAVLDYFNSVNKIRIGAQRQFYEFRVKHATLSDATNTYTSYTGLRDANAIGIPANGMYFSYTHGTSSGQWTYTCRNGSTGSPTASGITVVAATWYILRIEVNAAGNSVSFFINNALVGTTTGATIPASTIGMRPLFQIDKTVGTTARTFIADYAYWKMFR